MLGVESDGDLTKVNALDGHTPQTADHTAVIADLPINVWNYLTSGIGVGGSVGLHVINNLNATVTSRASQTSVDTVDSIADTIVSRKAIEAGKAVVRFSLSSSDVANGLKRLKSQFNAIGSKLREVGKVGVAIWADSRPWPVSLVPSAALS